MTDDLWMGTSGRAPFSFHRSSVLACIRYIDFNVVKFFALRGKNSSNTSAQNLNFGRRKQNLVNTDTCNIEEKVFGDEFFFVSDLQKSGQSRQNTYNFQKPQEKTKQIIKLPLNLFCREIT